MVAVIKVSGAPKVALDVAHGWHNRKAGVYDPGASWKGKVLGVVRTWKENVLSKAIVMDLKKWLEAQGFDVLITTGKLTSRAAKADKWGADLLVSVHFNGRNVDGSETFVHTRAGKASKGVQAELQARLVRSLGLRDRGRKRMGLAVCSGKAPAVLLEVCGMNASNLAAYRKNHKKLVAQLGQGLLAVFGKQKLGPKPGPVAPAAPKRVYARFSFHGDLADLEAYKAFSQKMGDALVVEKLGSTEEDRLGFRTWKGNHY